MTPADSGKGSSVFFKLPRHPLLVPELRWLFLRYGGGLGRVASVLSTIKGRAGGLGQYVQRSGLSRGKSDSRGIGGLHRVVLWVVRLKELRLFDFNYLDSRS